MRFLFEGLMLFKKRMVFELFPVWPEGRVFLEHGADEVFEFGGHLFGVIDWLVKNEGY